MFDVKQLVRLPGRSFVFPLLLACLSSLRATEYPAPAQAEYTIHDFRFANGESLHEVRMHYRTLGQPIRDDKGVVRNAVLILHGTTGSSSRNAVGKGEGRVSLPRDPAAHAQHERVDPRQHRGVHWRGRLSEVSEWSFGHVGAPSPASVEDPDNSTPAPRGGTPARPGCSPEDNC